MQAPSSNTSVGGPNSSQINAAQADYPIFGSNARQWDYRRNQSYLDEDAWREVDDLQIRTAQDELNLVDRLRANNLVDTVPIEKTISIWNELGGSGEAEIDMDGRSQTVEDLPDEDPVPNGVPIPLIASAFRLGHRGREATSDIQDAGIVQKTRAVLEEMEGFVARGWDRTIYDGGETNNGPFQIYGVLNHPDRNPNTGASWSTDVANVETDILDMINTLEDNRFSGPYDLWLNPAQVRPMRNASPNYDNQRVRETILDLPEVGNITTSEWIPEGEAVMLDLQREVIDAKLGDGNTTNVAEWDSSPFETRFKVYSAFAPRVKSRPVEDADTRESGIVHTTGIA